MSAGPLLMAACLALAQADKPEPPPLTEEQRTRLTELVRTTQAKSTRLRSALEEKQKALAKLYSEFQLDEKAASQLEAEILNVQRQLLDNYHQMQVELRKNVGKERFDILKRRLDNVLNPQPPAKPLTEEKRP